MIINRMIFHGGGAPPLQSTIDVMLEILILSIVLMGWKLGRTKAYNNIIKHRDSMTIATAINSLSIFIVMMPSFYSFLFDPNLELLKMSSIVFLLHGTLGVFAMVFSFRFIVVGIRLKNLRRWMRITLAFWIVTLLLGILSYFLIHNFSSLGI
jgi:uncharacterized membrane protein YozB (DUF420 family)